MPLDGDAAVADLMAGEQQQLRALAQLLTSCTTIFDHALNQLHHYLLMLTLDARAGEGKQPQLFMHVWLSQDCMYSFC